MGKAIDITGQKFGRLTAIKLDRIEKRKGGGTNHYWLFKCDCGNEIIKRKIEVLKGSTQSCGCLAEETRKRIKTKHGQRHTLLYWVWLAMKQRCYNPKTQYYYLYGGKGIKVCNEWKDDFKVFSDWAYSNGYEKGLSIDRIDANKDYDPNNCRWVDAYVQANNTSRNRYITYKGETHTLAEWVRMYNKNYDKIRNRLNKLNWSIERALNTP